VTAVNAEESVIYTKAGGPCANKATVQMTQQKTHVLMAEGWSKVAPPLSAVPLPTFKGL